jgi:hypothetical protein
VRLVEALVLGREVRLAVPHAEQAAHRALEVFDPLARVVDAAGQRLVEHVAAALEDPGEEAPGHRAV